MTKVLIVTDAWHPQINGVVRCLSNVGDEFEKLGHTVRFVTPALFWTMPMPTYPEIRLSLASLGHLEALIDEFQPNNIHIATEGPLGLLARQVCLNRRYKFTSSFHTRFAEYVAARWPVPHEWSYAYLRWFHEPACATLAPTPSTANDLAKRGFSKVVPWTRGVDHAQFAPGRKSLFKDLPGPHLLYVGRVAVEKNVEAFLQAACGGTKIVVGEGPQREELQAKHPSALFLGAKTGSELTACYQSADVLVFPSRTDTFGNVMIEALACGTPVAAYPVMGPIDVLTDARAGAMDNRIENAIQSALKLAREDARAHALRFTWRNCAEMLLERLEPLQAKPARAA